MRLELIHRAEWSHAIDSQLMSLAASEGLISQRTASWVSKRSVWDVDEIEVVSSITHAHSDGGEILFRTDEALVQVYRRGTSVELRIAAATQADAEAAETRMRELLPERRETKTWDGTISVNMWSTGANGATSFSRSLPVQLIDEMAANYAHRTLRGLHFLRTFEPPPTNGRLIVLHGGPGTGKSHAVLSLGAEWRSWADLHVITDPENVFRDPNYLINVIGGGSHDEFMAYVDPDDEVAMRRRSRAKERWKIIVLEDAGEFMSLQARAETGQALSRLLNMTDGIIGTASKALLVVTTNEHVGDLHPAVSRPGRCHLALEFEELGEDRIVDWCEANDVADIPRCSVASVAELYAWKRGDRRVDERQAGFGFAA